MMRTRRQSSGFGMVEILVAMMIGMITVLVIMQVMATTESQRRTVTSGSDSGTAGTLAMNEMQRDLMNAGYGLMLDTSLFDTCGANQVFAYNSQRNIPDPTANAITFAAGGFLPIVINPPGMAAPDANTDIIQVTYSSSDFFAGRGVKVTDSLTVAGAFDTVIGEGFVSSGIQAGDLALVVQQLPPPQTSSCLITQISTVPTVNQLTRAAGVWNQAGNLNRGISFTAAAPGMLYSLGSPERFSMRAFAVRSGRLTACSPMYQNCAVASQWLPVAEGVVSVRAEIGVDSVVNPLAPGEVDVWAMSLPVQVPALTWESVKSIRVALTARGQHRERDAIPNADCTPSWAGNNNDSPVVSLPCPVGALAASDRRIVLNSANTPDAAAWAQYRHRVVQTIVPLRNAFWSNN